MKTMGKRACRWVGRMMAMLTLAAVILMSGGCAQFAMVSESLFMMSPTQEVDFGKKVQAEVAKEYKLLNDPEVTGYIRDLGMRVWAKSPQSPFSPTFHVVADESINAFAIPGGSVYVHTGLISAADDEAELAAVIAHEIGHVVGRHSARQVSRATGVSLIEQVALGTDAGQASQLISTLLSQGVMFNYSRADEREADQIGVGTLHRLGYDPTAMITFFQKLIDKYGDSNNRVATLFATHPPTSERIADVKATIATLPRAQYTRPVTDLRRVQGRISQLGLAGK